MVTDDDVVFFVWLVIKRACANTTKAGTSIPEEGVIVLLHYSKLSLSSLLSQARSRILIALGGYV